MKTEKKEKGKKREVKKEVKLEESEGEEEMMFDVGRERRRGEKGAGGAGAKKVGPLRKGAGGKVLGHYAHIDDAKALMQGLGLKSQKAFGKWSTTAARPVEIPSAPHRIYMYCGWKGYADYLGNPNTGMRKKNTSWRSLEAATTYIQALGLKSREAWREWRKSGARPEDIPSNPRQVYKKQGWVGYPEFLGYERKMKKKGKGQ